MQRVGQALCIGFGIAMFLFGMGTRWMRPIPNGSEVIHPRFHFLTLPGVVVQWIATASLRIHWESHLLLAQMLHIAGNVAFYSVAAYALLWLRSASKSIQLGPGFAWLCPDDIQPVWLALAIGLAITVIATVLLHMNFLRAIPNNEGGVTYTAAYPHLINLSLPGIALLWLAILATPVKWVSHPVLALVVVATGSFVFYSAAAYGVLRLSARLSAGLSARWKQG